MGGGGANSLNSPKTGENSGFTSDKNDAGLSEYNSEEEDTITEYTYKTYDDYFTDYNITAETITEEDLTGTGSATDPYVVHSTRGFLWLSNSEYCKVSLRGKYLEFDTDILLNDETFNENGEPSGGDGVVYNWYFANSTINTYVDGNGYKVHGLYSNTPDKKWIGLFGYGNMSSLSDLSMQNVWLNGLSYFGAFGYASKKLENCFLLSGFLYSGDYSGGILFQAQEVYNCVNYANIYQNTDTARYLSGIIAVAQNSRFKNCINYGNISGHSIIGGITSTAWGVSCEISCCENFGRLSVSSYGCGGVFGFATQSGEGKVLSFINCVNYGIIEGSGYGQGGIIGGYAGSQLILKNCKTYGKISGNGGLIIGILPHAHAEMKTCAEISNCFSNCDSDNPFIGMTDGGNKDKNSLDLSLKNNYTNMNGGSVAIFKNLHYTFSIEIDNFYIENKQAGEASLFGNINNNGYISLNNVFFVSNGNIIESGIYLKLQSGCLIEMNLSSFLYLDTINKSNNFFYGTDFSGFYIDWKTGRVGLKALSSKGFYQGNVTEDLLISKGYVKKVI